MAHSAFIPARVSQVDTHCNVGVKSYITAMIPCSHRVWARNNAFDSYITVESI